MLSLAPLLTKNQSLGLCLHSVTQRSTDRQSFTFSLLQNIWKAHTHMHTHRVKIAFHGPIINPVRELRADLKAVGGGGRSMIPVEKWGTIGLVDSVSETAQYSPECIDKCKSSYFSNFNF